MDQTHAERRPIYYVAAERTALLEGEEKEWKTVRESAAPGATAAQAEKSTESSPVASHTPIASHTPSLEVLHNESTHDSKVDSQLAAETRAEDTRARVEMKAEAEQAPCTVADTPILDPTVPDTPSSFPNGSSSSLAAANKEEETEHEVG